MHRLINTALLTSSTDIAASQNSDVADISSVRDIDINMVVAGNNGSNDTFTDTDVDIDEDTVTLTAHNYVTGMKITELTSTGTLPAGLATSTVYYAIVVDANTISFATSQANALSGTAVDITDAGTASATNTVVVATALAGTAKVQKTNDLKDVASPVWVDLDNSEVLNANNSQTISAAGNLNWVIQNCGAARMRVVVTITSGIVTAATKLSGK